MSISALFIDSREPTWVKQLKFNDAPKMVTELEYGDVWAMTDDNETICIERKTPTDLLGSIRDERLFCQAAGIRQKTPWSYLVITGVMTPTVTGQVVVDKRSTGWQWNSVQGALLTVQEMGVRVLVCADDGDYEATVMRLCERRRGNEYVIVPVVDAREMSDGEKFLTSLPGIGLERAKCLLDEFENKPIHALAWLTWHRWNTDNHVAGIGNGIKKAVRAAIGIDDCMVMDIVPDEMLQFQSQQKEKVAA